MFDINIHGLNIHNPLFYTESYLKNEYVKANDLAKHIHLFNHQISRIDYTIFNDLKGTIEKITEKVEQKISTGEICSEPFENYTREYYFRETLELYQIIKNEISFQEVILLFDSLKMPEKIQEIKFFDNNISSRSDVTYSSFLEYEQIETTNFYNNQNSKWIRENHRHTKYHFDKNGKTFKTYVRNNKDEQSKMTMIYDNHFRLLETKTFSQKNKSELLYEAVFTYENNGLQSIKYIRHKPTKFRLGNYTENLTFEYNKNGMLENLNKKFITTNWIYDQIGNPISIKEFDNNGICVFEKRYHYEYDIYNNWTFKLEKIFINDELKNEKQINREIQYYI